MQIKLATKFRKPFAKFHEILGFVDNFAITL
jgi:hypothetical protein